MKKSLSTTFLVFILSCFSSLVFAQEKITIATLGFDHPAAQIAVKVLAKVYGNLGYELDLKTYPPLRADHVFDQGEVDAYLFHEAQWANDHPDAILVNIPIAYDNQVVFTKNKKFTVNGWQSLKPYKIGYQRGMKAVEENIQGMNIDGSENPPLAFKKLDKGRDDIVVMPIGVGLMMLKRLNITGITVLNPPLKEVKLYHFLHKKNAPLADKVKQGIQTLQNSGELKKITTQVEQEFMQ